MAVEQTTTNEANRKWNFCVSGNIVKTRVDENGVLRYGTSGFSGGTKVYLQGKFWRESQKEQGFICAIGLSRGKRYECLNVPVNAIENVRFQRCFNLKVIDMMDDFEYSSAWWHRTANDKREAKAFVQAWNERAKEETLLSAKEAVRDETDQNGDILSRVRETIKRLLGGKSI